MALTTVRPQGMGFNTGRRNLIKNGAMQVAQRGTKALTGNPEAGFACDRFEFYQGGDADVTISQSTDAPSGSGFANSLKFDVVTADTSLGAGELYVMRQKLEGQDLQGMKKGTSSAESVTLQFWIKSSKTGTYILELFDIDNTRQISKSYTVSSANTWEHKSITFEGDTSGTFDNDNARSLDVQWWIAAGSDYTSGTLSTTWTANTSANRAVGQVNALDNAANEIYITGVQLELGTNASDFEHRSYGEELSLCKRYYQRWEHSGTPADEPIGAGVWYTSTQILALLTYDEMRAAPTFTASSTGFVKAYGGGFAEVRTGGSGLDTIGTKTARFNFTLGARTAGHGTLVQFVNAGDYLELDAEL